MKYRGTWVAQSVRRLTSVQVMISQFVSSRPILDCLLSEKSPLGILCPPLSAPPPLSLSLKINKHRKKEGREGRKGRKGGRKEGRLIYAKTGWLSRESCWVKKSPPQGHILYDSIYITFLKWENYSHGVQIIATELPKARNGGDGRGGKGGRWMQLKKQCDGYWPWKCFVSRLDQLNILAIILH